MTGMIVGNLVNIILDPILILTLDWTVAGAALATVLGNIVSALFYISHLCSKRSMLSIRLKHFTIKRSVSLGVFAIGIPAALNSVLMSTSNIVINKVMAGYGDMAVAGLGVAMKVNTICVMLLIGVGVGIQPLLGFCFGARMRKRYLAVLRFTLIVAFIMSIVMTVVCYVFAGPLVRFILEEPEAYAYGFEFSRVYILSGPVIGLLFVMINAIQSTGAMLPSLILSISRQGIIYYPMLIIFTTLFDTAKMAAMTQPVTDYIAATLAVILFIITFRKHFPKERAMDL
jgi:Na+-driven multidrug efflux pump